jgi:hypothetical protein
MKSRPQRTTNSSSRILDTYVSGLRAEVVRLSLMREQSEDTQWQSQLDMQIDLKLQLIDDVAQCLEHNDEDGSFTEMECNSQLILPTARLSVS